MLLVAVYVGICWQVLLVAVHVGICLERPSTMAVKLLICSLVAFMAFKCASCSALCAGLDLRCLAWLIWLVQKNVMVIKDV